MFRIARREDQNDDPRYANLATRMRHSEEIYSILEKMIADRTVEEWRRALDAAAIPVQKANTKQDLLDDEQPMATGFRQSAIQILQSSAGCFHMARRCRALAAVLQPRAG